MNIISLKSNIMFPFKIHFFKFAHRKVSFHNINYEYHPKINIFWANKNMINIQNKKYFPFLHHYQPDNYKADSVVNQRALWVISCNLRINY